MAGVGGYQQYGDPTYGNALRDLITDPRSFSGTPGFQFALNTAMDNVGRQAAARGMNTSGNVMGDLTRTATGLASGNYMDYAHLLGGLTGQEENYGLGVRAADTADYRAGTEHDLGMGRLGLDAELGRGNLALGTMRANQDYSLGEGSLANAAQRNANDFLLGGQRNANEAAMGQNEFNVNMFNAQTNRGNSLRDAYYRRLAATPRTFNTPGGSVSTFPRYY